jgi:hypothetical protein
MGVRPDERLGARRHLVELAVLELQRLEPEPRHVDAGVFDLAARVSVTTKAPTPLDDQGDDMPWNDIPHVA